jgi:membrane protein
MPDPGSASHQRDPMADKKPEPGTESGRNVRRIFRLRLKDIFGLMRQAAIDWSDDNALRLSASLAFYTLLSLAPLLVLMVAVAAVAFGRQAAEGQLAWQIQRMVGLQQAQALEAVIRAALKPEHSVIATVFSVVTLAIGATSVVVELQDALNDIWHVPHLSTSGFASVLILVRQRFLSLAMVLGAGFLLLILVLVSAWIAAIGKSVGSMLPTPKFSLHVASFLISFVVITFLFGAIYKIMPDVELKWSDVFVGASFTSLLFTTGKQLIGVYLGRAGIGSSYGAAGSLVIILVWVYYSAQLFFFGAEFTKVYARKYGSHFVAKLEPVPPKPNPVILTP